jgi:hypothetical protein
MRRDAPIAGFLLARGLRARIVVSRIDGALLSTNDIAEADAALVAFEDADRRAWKACAAANAADKTTPEPPKKAPKRGERR